MLSTGDSMDTVVLSTEDSLHMPIIPILHFNLHPRVLIPAAQPFYQIDTYAR